MLTVVVVDSRVLQRFHIVLGIDFKTKVRDVSDIEEQPCDRKN